MDIIYKTEWEYLKSQHSIWNKYEKSVPYDDRDLGVFDIGYGVVLPKFFIQYNYEELKIDKVGSEIIRRHELEKQSARIEPDKLKKMTTSIEARKEQIPVFKAIKDAMSQGSINGLIVAQPGFGKSIVAIKTVELVGSKSLIIVPNDILEGQFVESIIEFTNLTKDDIGIAQGSDINDLIKKGVFEKDIVVAKIQSLYAQLKNIDINILKELYSRFGLVIYDEAHVGNASDGYSKTACMFETDNVLSMTATPYRVGINEFLFMNNTGGILYKSEHQNLVPKINLHNGIIEFTPKEIQRLTFSRTDYVRFMATYNMILETKEVYFEWIANWVEYRIKQGHKTAILFATNKMVKRMANVLKRRGIDVGVIIGETKKKLEESKEYITVDQVQDYYDHYFETFPKRKKCTPLKQLKGYEDDGYYTLTKPILKEFKKVCEKFPALNSTIHKTIVDNQTEREIMKAKDTLVSNFKLLSAGFDKSDLSSIIFGSLIVGKVPVIQSLGRITRIDKTKNQDIQAHFMFTQQFMNFFPDMLHILVNNIKTQYPSDFSYEGFDFG